jgi:hypothetical protein
MSFDKIWNSENLSIEKTKNLSDIDISWVEQNYIRIQEKRLKKCSNNKRY